MVKARWRWVAVLVLGLASRTAWAEPYRLRADVFASAPDPSGFVLLQAEARERRPMFVDAEALVWTGVGVDARADPEARGEAVLAVVRMRDDARHVDGRFGRFLYQGGAIRPLHLDGAAARFRSPTGLSSELFAGIPVAPGSRGRSYDWLVGQRTVQSIGAVGSAGFSYWQGRDAGAIATSELGAEGSVFLTRGLSLDGTVALDTVDAALADVRVSSTLHDATKRLEVRATRRSPSRMLPATSLFAALGSYDADELRVSGSLRAAPRLALAAHATVESIAGRAGATQLARAELWLDDDGAGALGAEAQRASLPGSSWTGGRAWLRVPLGVGWVASTEAEVAVPDEPGTDGPAWPWVLAAVRWSPRSWLDVASAIELGSTPAYETVVGGLLRVSGQWGAP